MVSVPSVVKLFPVPCKRNDLTRRARRPPSRNSMDPFPSVMTYFDVLYSAELNLTWIEPMANEEHLSILKSGVSAWNKWRFEHREISPDLVAADLSGVSLYVVDLSGAHLSGVVLSRATLRGA